MFCFCPELNGEVMSETDCVVVGVKVLCASPQHNISLDTAVVCTLIYTECNSMKIICFFLCHLLG